MTSDTILGREEELRRVEGFLDGEAPRAAVIEGEPGIGKTTVWLAGLSLAESRGLAVLRARPAEAEARLSYVALADLLADRLDEVREALPEPQARALDVALLRGGGSAEPRTIATGLLTAVTALAAESPLVLAVDDVQWLDRASERALAFLARRLPPHARLLLTRRTTERDALPLELHRALPEVPVERIELGPLSLASLHHLIHERAGVALARPTLVRLQQASGGNPLFVLEVARALEHWEPTLGEAFPVPRDLRATLRRRIARLPDDARAALLRAAAASRPTTAIVEEDALVPAELAGIVRVEGTRVEFTHPLLASTVYSSARPRARRAVHAELAEAVEDVEERARHLALAATGPDERVAELLDAAAALARSRGAPDAAGELQERAATMTPESSPQEAHRRLAIAAEHYFHAGEPRRAQALLAGTLPHVGDRLLRGEFLRILGELRFTENSFPAAIDLLEEALVHVDSPEVAIAIRLDLAYAYLSVQDRRGAVEQAARAVSLAEELGIDALLGEAIGVRAIVGYLCGGAIDRLEIDRALALEDTERRIRLQMRPSAIAAMLAVSDGRLAEAVERLRAVCAAAVARGEESELPLLLAYLASAEWRRADYEAAGAVAEEIVRIGTQTGNEPALAIGLTHRGLSATFRGDVETARAAFAAASESMERTGWALGASYVRMGVAMLDHAVGDPAAVNADLEPITAAVGTGDWSDPELALFAPDAIEARIALGDLLGAKALLDALDSGRPGGTAWTRAEAARCRALYLAATGDSAGALAAAEEAVARAGALELPFVLGRARLVEGQIRRRLKRKLAARESLSAALALFEEIHTPLWAERARAELGRVGLRPVSSDDLTVSERRIAELAASGLTNREISQAAFVSPKTVEANLARAYRKLGIRSRAELGAWLAARQA